MQRLANARKVFIFAPMEERNDIVIYQSEDGLVKMEAMVDPVHETIWATQKAIAALFGKDVSDISRHIRNVYYRGELSEESTLQKMQNAFSDKPVQYYNLDISNPTCCRLVAHTGRRPGWDLWQSGRGIPAYALLSGQWDSLLRPELGLYAGKWRCKENAFQGT